MIKMLYMLLFMLIILLSMSLHYLEFLLGMEFLVISLLYLILNYQINVWFYLIYLVFSVCEAVLGLSLLVSMNFEYGHQKLFLLNLMI
uniref:NADH dehydrogenase subunit 4L n=1 Tax=Ceratina okinawana TaxID=236018 RepID=A0A7U0R6J7_9HYME|nr:NADH dehydrogenase subunit 4L [Ceratina okinawana]QQX27995.1 NADH dehydrogenase subunit 4L [Ceratina okinawana]